MKSLSQFLTVLLLLSTPAFAHEPTGGTPEDLAEMQRFLGSVFLQVHRGDPLKVGNLRAVALEGPKGEPLYIERTELTQVLLDALLAIRPKLEKEHEHCCHDHPKFFTWLLAPIRGERDYKRWRHDGSELLEKAMDAVKRTTVKLPGAAAEMASRYGIVPAVVIAVTYPPWTAATEILESFVMGPLHVFCTASQAVYFGTVDFMVTSTRKFNQVLFNRGSGLWLGARFAEATRSRADRWRFKSLNSRLLLESSDAILRKKDYVRKRLKSSNRFERLLTPTSLWKDVYELRNNANFLGLERTPAEIDRIFDEPDRQRQRFRIFEWFEAMTVIRNLVNAELELARELGQLSYRDYLKSKSKLGGWYRYQEGFLSSLMLTTAGVKRGAFSPSALAGKKDWAKRTYDHSLKALASLSRQPEDPANLENASLALKGMKDEMRVQRWGDGVSGRCRQTLASLGSLSLIGAGGYYGWQHWSQTHNDHEATHSHAPTTPLEHKPPAEAPSAHTPRSSGSSGGDHESPLPHSH